jgi:uncharacterized protein (DUF302 family)
MNTTEFAYGVKTTIDASLEGAHARVVAALKDEGFGVLTEIDIAAAFKEKLGTDFRPYRILGACNPPLAHKALGADLDIGLLLPCNVVIYEADEPGKTVVATIDPVVQLRVTGREDIEPLAKEVRERMERVLAVL